MFIGYYEKIRIAYLTYSGLSFYAQRPHFIWNSSRENWFHHPIFVAHLTNAIVLGHGLVSPSRSMDFVSARAAFDYFSSERMTILSWVAFSLSPEVGTRSLTIVTFLFRSFVDGKYCCSNLSILATFSFNAASWWEKMLKSCNWREISPSCSRIESLIEIELTVESLQLSIFLVCRLIFVLRSNPETSATAMATNDPITNETRNHHPFKRLYCLYFASKNSLQAVKINDDVAIPNSLLRQQHRERLFSCLYGGSLL